MKILVAYICVSKGWRSLALASRFVSTWQRFPPEAEHKLVIVFNGGKPRRDLRSAFNPIPHGFHERSNAGWDIGAYQDVASRVDCHLLVCLGETVHFHRAGWLRRLEEARAAHGHGMYGLFSSYLVAPHLNTTAFAVSPEFLRSYPINVVTKADRYQFEHGTRALWREVSAADRATKLVTWDGEWDREDWRKPDNILWRGDQSNCLAWCNHTERYVTADPEKKERWERGADGHAKIEQVAA